PAARAGQAAGLPRSGPHRHRFPGGAADRAAGPVLCRAPRSGRSGGGVRSAAGFPAGAPAPARTVDRVRRATTPGARICALARRARAAHLGRDRLDPVQPAPATGGPAMTAIGWNTLVQPEAVAAALGDAQVVLGDCRFSLADPVSGERAYRQSHVTVARYAHLDRAPSHPPRPPLGRHPPPDASVDTRHPTK